MQVPDGTTVSAREAQAWRMRARGSSQQRIAEVLGLTQSGISRLLARVERRELKRLSESVERLKAVQNAQLEHVVEESVEAWHRSKTPRKRAASKRATGGGGNGDDDGQGGDEVTTTEVIERDGDTSYLYAAMQALAQIRSLWGLDVAPAQHDSTSTIAELTRDLFQRGADHEQREQAEAHQARDPGGADRADPGGAEAMPAQPEPVQ